MSQFSTSLQTILTRSYGDKQTALAAASGINQVEVGRLLRDTAPLTSEKLEKLISAEGMTAEDRTLLIHAAIRDFIGEGEYQARFAPNQSTNIVRDDLGGPIFQSLFPLNPRAEQVLRYLINKAGQDSDVSKILELMGSFLELPPPLTENDT